MGSSCRYLSVRKTMAQVSVVDNLSQQGDMSFIDGWVQNEKNRFS